MIRRPAEPCRTAPGRREPGSRTPYVLIPNQARSPCRAFPIGPMSSRFAAHWTVHAIRCGVLNDHRRARPEGREREQGRQGSNLLPAVLETAALPGELHPYVQLSMERKSRPVPVRVGGFAVRVALAAPPTQLEVVDGGFGDAHAPRPERRLSLWCGAGVAHHDRLLPGDRLL